MADVGSGEFASGSAICEPCRIPPGERAQQVAGLPSATRSRVEARLLATGRKLPGRTIPRAEGPGPFPLSFSEHASWVIDRMEPGTALYHIARAARLSRRDVARTRNRGA